MSAHLLEICCGDIESVIAARSGGADRVELCAALEIGGITPSLGLVREAVRIAGPMRVNVLIRPRGGDFLYTPSELDIMVTDIRAVAESGADGVVIGALNADGTIDINACRMMVKAAHGLDITFHRAFDVCSDLTSALETVIDLGCDTILTSGGAPTAVAGIDSLRRIAKLADGRIDILGASGVSPANAALLMAQAGLTQLHASARSPHKSQMTYRNTEVAMGNPDTDEYTRMITDPDIVKTLSSIIHS